MEDNRPIIVSILCLAYNHEPYIRDCLDGFVMQKTDFRFKAIVHDDASTDGTADIIREYAARFPSIIVPILETENQYSKKDGSLDRIMNEHSEGKYIAICEGDDYWIDPLKLQKQIQFLEVHPDYGMVYGLAKFRRGNDIYGCHGTTDCSFEGLLTYSNFPTLTRVFRKSIYDQYIAEVKPQLHNWMMGDYPMAFYFVLHSKIKCFEEFLAVYRLIESSASHSKDINYLFRFYDSADDVRRFFVNRYILDKEKREQYESLIRRNEIEYKMAMFLIGGKKAEARRFLHEQGDSLATVRRFKFKIMSSSRFLYKVVVVYGIIINKLKRICPIKH